MGFDPPIGLLPPKGLLEFGLVPPKGFAVPAGDAPMEPPFVIPAIACAWSSIGS